MARLPQAADLIKEPKGAQTRAIRVKPVDFSPMARGSKAMAAGIGSAIEASWKANEEAADYETKKRLSDFRLETESELDEYRKTMQPGAPGFSEGWSKIYKKRADGFVKSLSDERQKNMVQASLIAQGERLGGAVQNWASKENDRYVEEGLSTTLNGLVGRVDRSPDAMRETRSEGRRLIESANLSPARKSVLLKKYRTEVEKSAVLSRLSGAKTPEQFEAIRKDLAGRASEDSELDAGRTVSNLKTFNLRVPTASERRKIFKDGGVVVNLDTNSSEKGGQTSPMVVIPDGATPEQRAAAEAYAKRIAEVYEQQFGKSLAPRVVTRSENGRGRPATMHTEPYSVKDGPAVEFFNSEEGQALHAQILQDTLGNIPGVRFSIPHNPAKGDRGAAGPGGDEVEFARRLMSRLQDGEGDGGEKYAGPYKNLDANARRTLQRAVASQYAKMQNALKKEITALEENAANGYALPESDLNALQQKIEGGGSPELKAKFAGAVNLAKLVGGLQKNRPEANESYLNSIRARFAKEAPTPEQREMLEKVEKAVSRQQSMLKNNSLTWSMRSGVVPKTQLNLSDEASMDERLSAIDTTAKQFGTPKQYFTEVERESIAKQLKSGDASIGAYAVALTKHWGASHAQRALREISSQAPEAALLGGHVATIGATAVSKDAEEGLRLVKEKGYKPMPAPRQEVDSSLNKAIGKTFVTMPKTWNAIRTLANAAYESRARKNAWTEFDGGEYEKIVRELTGEREVNGVKYGGISYTEGGYLWGGTQTVVIPHDVRQDAFDDLRDMVKLKDLKDKPVNAQGKVISDQEFAEASLITAGNGQYYLSAGDQDLNEVYRSKDGTPYIFRFDEVRPMLKKKTRGSGFFLN